MTDNDHTKLGSNSKKYHKDIVDAVAEYNRLDEISADCNEQRKEIRERLADMGFDTKAFEVAAKHAAWDAAKRERFDISYDTCREALGAAFNAQGDLFKFSKEAREAAKADEDGDISDKLGGEPDTAEPEREPDDEEQEFGAEVDEVTA